MGKKIDLGLAALILLLIVFGLIMVYSSSFIYAEEKFGDGLLFVKRQVAYVLLGGGVLFGTLFVPTGVWALLANPLLAASTVLLGLVNVPGIGLKVGGARRWLHLAGFHFQPSELAKFAILVFVSKQLGVLRERKSRYELMYVVPAMVLLLFQPDFGTSVIIAVTVSLLFFLSGISLKRLAVPMVFGVLAAGALVVFSPYRRARVISYLDPWSDPGGRGFQILQSFVGLHQGRFFGVGLGNGKEKLFYLPEAHNDFILSVIGEELGFIGVTAVAIAFLVFVFRGLKIGWQRSHQYGDQFGMLLASGITLVFGIQAFVNMSVVLGLLPTKGLTLPFISYGGSALVVSLGAIGVLLRLSKENRASL